LFEDAAALAPPFWTIKRIHYAALSPRQLSSKTPTATAGAAYYVVDEAGQLLGEHDATGAPIYETIYLGSLPVGVMKQTGSAATSDIAVNLYNLYADHIATPRIITRQDHAIVWRWDKAGAGQIDTIYQFIYNFNDAKQG
jgi:hypothetical protein